MARYGSRQVGGGISARPAVLVVRGGRAWASVRADGVVRRRIELGRTSLVRAREGGGRGALGGWRSGSWTGIPVGGSCLAGAWALT